ncbi:DUF6712 family protein [Lutibacter sp.]|uniref:DUF6712 family protein n=1 Tax=Lutibacter sp. TaxID=1925666 RepID=UPI00356526DA
MKLLFNSDDTLATAELKELLGFIDADIKFANIRSKIITATNDVIAVVGKEMYDLAVLEYEKAPEAENKNKDLIFSMRNPIAIQAYRLFAPHNDLSHTNKGRLNRLEDKEKTAFEWMIDKDDKALEKSYYRAMDDLIMYLESSIEAWEETEAYKKTHSLFISTANEFDDIFPIGNSRLLFLKLAPGIRRCEDNNIKARIGEALYTSLKEDPSTNKDLVKKIKEACVYSSMAWAMRRLSVQLFPEGVLQGFVSERMTINAKKAPEYNEPYAVAHYFEADAKEIFKEIETIIYQLNKLPDEVIEPITFNPDSNDKFLST